MPDANVIDATYEQILEAPTTGTPGKRTPRSEFEMPQTGGRDKEVVLILDASGSNLEQAAAGSSMTKVDLVAGALPLVVGTLENDDAQAAEEQAGGSSELGGARTFAFCWNGAIVFKKGEDESDDPRDLGDINTANIADKLEQYRSLVEQRGQTFVMPAIAASETAFQAEFGDPASPHFKPLRSRPAQEILVITDGKLHDGDDFEHWLDQTDETCVVAVAVIGEGREHDEAVAHYQRHAAKSQYLTVVSLSGVDDPREVATDLRLLSGTAPGTPDAA